MRLTKVSTENSVPISGIIAEFNPFHHAFA